LAELATNNMVYILERYMVIPVVIGNGTRWKKWNFILYFRM